jgi:hypothetical protein
MIADADRWVSLADAVDWARDHLSSGEGAEAELLRRLQLGQIASRCTAITFTTPAGEKRGGGRLLPARAWAAMQVHETTGAFVLVNGPVFATIHDPHVARADLERLWPSRATGAPQVAAERAATPAEAPKRGGRPPKIDWPTLEDALRVEIETRGRPDPEGEAGWQRPADVGRWATAYIQDKGWPSLAPSTLKDHLRQMLAGLPET